MGEEDTHVLNKDLKQIFKLIQSCCGKWRSYSTAKTFKTFRMSAKTICNIK